MPGNLQQREAPTWLTSWEYCDFPLISRDIVFQLAIRQFFSPQLPSAQQCRTHRTVLSGLLPWEREMKSWQ